MSVFTGRIVGVDPGTECLGFAAIDYDLETLSIIRREAMTFKSQYLAKDEIIVETHGDRIARIYAQKANLTYHLANYLPEVVCCEAPFYNRLRPNAYAPLVETVFAIQQAVVEYDPQLPFYKYPPLTVKKVLGAIKYQKLMKSKDAIKKAAEDVSELSGGGFLEELDEHSIDALCVAYTYLLSLRKERKKG